MSSTTTANRFGPGSSAQVLLQAGLLSEAQLRSAVAVQAQWGGRLVRAVVELRYADERAVAEALARGYGLPRVELSTRARDGLALGLLDGAFCREHGVYPCALSGDGRTLELAVADPGEGELLAAIAQRTHCRVKPAVAGELELRRAVEAAYSLAPEAPRRAPAANQPGEVFTPPGALPAAPAAGTSARELAERLDRMQAELDKTKRILRALADVCMERGVLTREDLAEAVKKVGGR